MMLNSLPRYITRFEVVTTISMNNAVSATLSLGCKVRRWMVCQSTEMCALAENADRPCPIPWPYNRFFANFCCY